MKRAKAPAPIDPVKTAAASTATNIATATANTAMGNVNQVGPESSLTYNQSGTREVRDPFTGVVTQVPTYTAETKLNPQQQALYDSNLANRQAMSGQAGQMLAGFGGVGASDDARSAALYGRVDAESAPFMNQARNVLGGIDGAAAPWRNAAEGALGRLPGAGEQYQSQADRLLAGLDSGGDIRGRTEAALMARLNPQIERDRASMETRLANQGLVAGSRAYGASQDDFGRSTNDARLSAILAAGNEERATRGARVGEIAALGGEARAARGMTLQEATALQGTGLATRQGLTGEAMNLQQMGLGTRGQFTNEAMGAAQEGRAARGQRLNEIGFMQSGGAQPVPQYSINRPAQAATTDTAGLINTQQAQQMQAFQQQQASNQGILGGLFGLGSAAIMASDKRLKTDIDKVEDRPGEQPDVYDFRYKTDPKGTKRRGYMAQEVRKTQPDAVKKMGKFLAVDYSKLPAVR